MRPLATLGNVNVDLILGPAEPWPRAGTEIIVDHNELRVGGCAGNSALAWDALGIDYVIAANTGQDQFGAWLRAAFGPKAAHWPVEPVETTLSVGITHPDGERTFFTTRGHLPFLGLNGAFATLDGEALRGGILLLSAPYLTDRLTSEYTRLFDWADAHDIGIALDTGWPLSGWSERIKQDTLSWVRRCSFCLFNEIETTTLSGRADVIEASRALQALMPAGGIWVTKRGAEGALAIDGEGQLHSAEAPAVQVIDSIGAGDVFNAAFLAALTRELPLGKCLAIGTEVASTAVSTLPRRYGVSMATHIDGANR